MSSESSVASAAQSATETLSHLISILRVSPVVQDDAAQKLHQVSRKCNDLLDLINKDKPGGGGGARKQSVLQTSAQAAKKGGPADDGGKKIRRGEISAEAAAGGTASSDFQTKLQDKDAKTTELLSQVVGTNILFTGLGEAETADVVKAFEQVKFEAGANVITQGERGENFYVVDSGILTVTVSNDGFTTQCGDLVSGAGFGELALMYNTPRAATVTTATGCVMWSLCRTIFKAITNFHKQKRMQDDITFLKKVEILEKLNDREIALVADAAERETFEAETTIIRQGESGDHFYLIMSGSVSVKVDNADVSTLKEGQYFGEKALMSEEVRAATCVASSRVVCLSLGRNQFKERLGKLQDILERKEAPKPQASSSQSTPGGPSTKDEYYLEIALNELEEKRTLGQGAFGRVKLVTHKTTGQTYALKCLIKEDIVANNLQDHVMNERNVMRMLDHPFILHLHNTYKDDKYVYFLLELALGGELFTFLRKMGRFNEKTGRFYAAQVVLGFQHMHSKDILYRDLKPENLILDSKGYLKIVDFGLAKVCSDKTWTLCGTPDYLAPEIILSRGHDKAVDYWALGVLVYEMCAGYVPFYSDDPMEVYQLILAGDLRFPSHLSRACNDMCKRLMNPQATKRLGTLKNGIKDIIKHKWFSGFDWKGLIEFDNAAPIQVAIQHAEDASNFDFYPEEDESRVPACPQWDPDF